MRRALQVKEADGFALTAHIPNPEAITRERIRIMLDAMEDYLHARLGLREPIELPPKLETE